VRTPVKTLRGARLLDVQLNLKNDILRRRYDGLKYDIKKIEEGQEPQYVAPDLLTGGGIVVYDISLRKLAPPPSTISTSITKS